MNPYNLLFYEPLAADALYHKAPDARQARKMLYKLILTEVLLGGEFCPPGSRAERYHKTYMRMLKIVLALMYPGVGFLLFLAAGPNLPISDTVFAVILLVLAVPGLGFFVLLMAALRCMLRFRKRLLADYLAEYEPRCPEWPAQRRCEAAAAGVDRFFHPEVWAELDGSSDFVSDINTYWNITEEDTPDE